MRKLRRNSSTRWTCGTTVTLLLSLLALTPLSCAAAPAPLELSSPVDYQVFQRETKVNGKVLIEGMVTIPNATNTGLRLEARFSGPLSTGQNEWGALPLDLRVRRFQSELPLPAGGWYELTVRLVNGMQTIAQATVGHVGVGEIFVIAGQSNSANHGEGKERPKSPLVVARSKGKWQPADDPQPGASGSGGSFIPAFGDAMAARFKVPIGIVACGVGATSVREWLPKGEAIAAPPTTGAHTYATGSNAWASSGELFDKLVWAHRPARFRALLWHQGESDNHQPPDREISPDLYRKYLRRVIEASRAQVGWQVPWFIALASYHTPEDRGSPELRASQKSLVADGLVLEGPNTDELGPEFRESKGRGVHFNARGLQEHGRLWAEKVAPWLESQLGQ
jgi:hypothetical protein